jgi:hypothetical protein
MPPRQLSLVRANIVQVSITADATVARFWAHLRCVDRLVDRPIGAVPLAKGRHCLMALGRLVNHSASSRQILLMLDELVGPDPLRKVGAEGMSLMARAGLATLEDLLGSDFDSECRDAWLALYRAVLDAMIASAAFDLESTAA